MTAAVKWIPETAPPPLAPGRPPLLVVGVSLPCGDRDQVTVNMTDVPPDAWAGVVRAVAAGLLIALAPDVAHRVSGRVRLTSCPDLTDPGTWLGTCDALPGSTITCHWQGVLA